MIRTRAIPSALRRAALPTLASVLIVVAGCSDTSDVSTDSAPATTATSSDGASADSAAPDALVNAAPGGETSDLGGVGTLDSATVHSIAVELDDAEYEAMLETYSSTGQKEWIEATVTIDGTTYEQVGIRLKGNSSLRGIAGGGGGAMSDGSSSQDPETMPWLIDLDHFIDGQSHDGLSELVVRSNGTATSLNEAVALELLQLAGLASQDAVAAAFSVNGTDEILRLVIDNPDDEWMAEELDASGALYKADSGGDWSYRGEDPDAYEEVFDQEAGDDNADLTPLINLLQFINESDDATFAAELPERLDVDAFATYLAMQDLLANTDDIDGPGNNAYLYYDNDTGQFTVVPWDYNLAFGSGPGGGPGARGGAAGQLPAGVAQGDTPAGPTPTEGEDGGFGAGRGVGGRSNVLVERFLAVDEWNALYEEKVAQLQAELYDGGVAQGVLDQWSTIVASSALVDDATIAGDAERISQQL